MSLILKTTRGKFKHTDSLAYLNSVRAKELNGQVDLIITSPPFPLNNKKQYGNKKGDDYLQWFTDLAPLFSDLLSEKGSLVIEIGNAWEPGRPVQSLLHLECLLALVKHPDANLRLIQEFICYNPSKLPSPAQWVTINRIRTVDSYTHVWWIAKSDYPKADNKKVLKPYSKSMINLLKRKNYNAGKRPSEHVISEKSFLENHGGSIAHNFFELDAYDESREVRLPHSVLSFSNSTSNDFYSRTCRKHGITPHPARMNNGLINFFIEFLTGEGDLVLDPFAGSNTTGYCAEILNRKWRAFEIKENYLEQAVIRFSNPEDGIRSTKYKGYGKSK